MELFDPLFDLDDWFILWLACIDDHDGGVGITVVCWVEAFVFFLAQGIPDFEFTLFCFVVVHEVDFGVAADFGGTV